MQLPNFICLQSPCHRSLHTCRYQTIKVQAVKVQNFHRYAGIKHMELSRHIQFSHLQPPKNKYLYNVQAPRFQISHTHTSLSKFYTELSNHQSFTQSCQTIKEQAPVKAEHFHWVVNTQIILHTVHSYQTIKVLHTHMQLSSQSF